MKNVVLIGATGYVGTALLNELLSRGHKVTAISRDASKVKIQNEILSVVEADITDPAQLVKVAEGKDAIVSAYNPGWGNPHIYEDTLDDYPKIVKGANESSVSR